MFRLETFIQMPILNKGKKTALKFLCVWAIVILCLFWSRDAIAGNCNVIISNNLGNVNIGDIHLECNGYSDDEIKEIKSKIEKYNKNIEKINNLYKDIMKDNKALKERQDKSDSKIKLHDDQLIELRNSQNLAEEKLQDIWDEHERLRVEVAKSYAALQEMAGKTVQDALAMESNLEQRIENDSGKLYQQIDSILRRNEKQIQTIEKRVDKLENDNSFLMDAWLNGNLQDSVGYFSGSAASWYSKQDWAPKFSVEYERLMPPLENDYLNNISFFGEIGWLKWTEADKFKTLPGIPESELRSNHNIVNLSVGTRVFHKLGERSHFYVLLSGGHSIAGSEATFSYATGAGIEYTRKSVRASLEIRWEGFTTVEQTSVAFNAFGNTIVDRSPTHQGGPLLAARIAFR